MTRRPIAGLIMLCGIETSFFELNLGGLIFLIGLVLELTAWIGE